MRHLTTAEIADAAANALGARGAAHLERCAACRARVAEARAAWDAAGDVPVPEPSPLYWTHMAARVRERVADETILPAWRARGWRDYVAVSGLRPAALVSALALAAVVFGVLLLRHPASTVEAPGMDARVPAPPARAVAETEDAAMWDALRFVAADVPFDEAHPASLVPAAGSIDRAVQHLSPEELAELDRLLRTELRHAGT
jgi:hypothetical protein